MIILIIFDILGATFSIIFAVKVFITCKEYNNRLSNKKIKNVSITKGDCDSDIGLTRAFNKKTEYTGHPTKQEYEENVRKINERELNNISRIVELPFDEIVNMYYEDHINTIKQVDEQIGKITSSPKLVLKMKRKNKDNSEN